jgi:hypothetical protein
MTSPNARGGNFPSKIERYLSQWQFYLSHNAHENEADCDHRRTPQLLFHKIGKFQARQLLFSLGERISHLLAWRVAEYQSGVENCYTISMDS